MLPLLSHRRLERPLYIVEDAVAVDSTALEVAIVTVSDADDLLSGLHLLDDFKGGSVEDLDVSLVEGHHDEFVVAHGVESLEFAGHFLPKLKLIG